LKRCLIFWGIVILAFAGLVIFNLLNGNVVLTSQGTTSYSFLEDTFSFYNFSINNTETLSVGNITQVNVTLPVSFNLSPNSNGSDTEDSLFQPAGNVLSWTNSSGLVMNLTLKNFWFNATTVTPGNYNLTISVQNQTGIYSSNLSVQINDTTVPNSISFVSPTEANESIVSKTYIRYNVSATDNLAISNIVVSLYNATSILNATSSSTTSPFSGNFSGLAEGDYYINASVNDTAGNINYTIRIITLHTTPPEISLVDPASAEIVTSSPYRFSFQVSSSIKVENCTLIINNTATNTSTNIVSTNRIYRPLTKGTYNWNVNCTDAAGNKASSTKRNFTVNFSAATVTSTNTDAGTTPNNASNYSQINYTSILLNNTQLAENYSQIVPKNVELKFEVANSSHSVKIANVTNTSINIIVASTPQQATLLIGEEKKFEVNGDNYRDLKIKLNSINTTGYANLTIKEIHELIANATTQNSSATNNKTEKEPVKTGFIIVIIVVALLIGGAIFGVVYFLKKAKKVKEEKLQVNNPVFGQGSESNSNGQVNQPRY